MISLAPKHNRVHDIRRLAVRVYMFNFGNNTFIPSEVSRDNHDIRVTRMWCPVQHNPQRQVTRVPFPCVQTTSVPLVILQITTDM